MWLELATIRGIMLAFTTILLQNTVKAEEQTTNLSNVFSTVVTEPSSNISIQSSLHAQANPKTDQFQMRNTSFRLATNGHTIISKEITDIVDSTSLPYHTKEASLIRGVIPTGTISSIAKVGFSTVYRVESSPVMSSFNNFKKTVIVVQTLATSRQEISFTPIPVKERNENSTQEIIFQRHSVSMFISSSIQPTPQYISHKSTTLISIAFSNYKQSSVTLGALGEITASDTGKSNVSISVPWKNSKIIMRSMSPVKLRQSTNSTVSIMSSISKKSRLDNSTASAALSTFKNISAKAQMNSNSTSAVLSFEVKQPNKTSVLEPSPSLVSRQNRSKTNMVLTSPVIKTTEMLYSKISKSTILLAQNDTMVQHSISSSELLAHNYTSKLNSTKEKILEKTTNLGNINTSSLVATFHNKTLVPTLMMSSKMLVFSDINAIANRTMIRSYISALDPFTKMSSNQTHIRDNITTFGVTVTPTILPFYKTVTNRTEKIQVSLSGTMIKKSEVNYTIYATGSTNSTRNDEISKTLVDIKPTSTTSFKHTEIQYSTLVSTTPTSSPEKLISQKFSVTIKITSEEFKKEYSSARASREKSKEIEKNFDKLFKNMTEYVFTEVLRFFNGSLGCDLIIHTESEESKPVSVDKINKILNKASNTEEGLGKFVVGNVEEISPEVQGKDDDKSEKKTWGRMPIIVISILAGVCLVLFVMVITQCIQKRHYSHSLADTNEIQEYSPAIQLKYNDDDSTFKDEERVPMTTFNQTDIY